MLSLRLVTSPDCLALVSGLMIAAIIASPTRGQETGPAPLSFEQLAALRSVSEIAIANDGATIAFTLNVPRRPGQDDDGPMWRELHVARKGQAPRPFVHGAVNVSQPRFSPDGNHIVYRAKRGDDKETAVWAVPVDGGESRRLVAHDTAISDYALTSAGDRIAFLADRPTSKARKAREKQGFNEEVFEEAWQPTEVWIATVSDWQPTVPRPSATSAETPHRRLEIDGSASHISWSTDGASLLVAIAPRSLIDDHYMHRKVRLLDAESGDTRAEYDHSGKLGPFALSPDGEHVAMISAVDPNDPKEGRLMVASAAGGALRNILPDHDEAHISRFAWRDATTLVYLADIGVETELGQVTLAGQRTTLLTSNQDGAPIVTGLAVAKNGALALAGDTSRHPTEVFRLDPGSALDRVSDSNPWLADVTLSDQRVVRWTARDGLVLEGILVAPSHEGPAPLMMIVHGGPEGHVRNGWVTSYSRPSQLAAGRGWAVFQPNYRGSTGRGVAFSKLGQGDAAGPEFDDLIDGVDHLVSTGVADQDRVGVTGGSYGGYATAWCSTRFTERFKAGVMFNGISNKHSKALTTDIPVEDRLVHTLYDPWTRASFALERSPLHHAEQSRTPLLILGGINDTRVHPSQSLQLYRALKLIGKTPVRFVRYPGEPHGNRRAASRDDYSRRLMRWMEHFVLEGEGALPPIDIERDVEPAADDDE